MTAGEVIQIVLYLLSCCAGQAAGVVHGQGLRG